MIVPMKHVTLLCVADRGEQTLQTLRSIGLVHLNVEAADSAPSREAHARLAANQKAQMILNAAALGKPVTASPAPTRNPEHTAKLTTWLTLPLPKIKGSPDEKIANILILSDMRQELINEADRLMREIKRIRPFGTFDAKLPARLAARGIPVTLFRATTDTLPVVPEGALLHILSTEGKTLHGVLIGSDALPETCERIAVPETDLVTLEQQQVQVLARADEIGTLLTQADEVRSELRQQERMLADQCTFTTACANLQAQGAVQWITGWCPADKVAVLGQHAETEAWGWLARDPDAGETVPTLLRPPRMLQPMLSLFKALGIAPTYYESDVSVPFFAFFGIFFAMLVGDGGYGMILLGLSRWGRSKVKPVPLARAPFTLLTVFSLATIVWGALSNTWFGFHPVALQNPVSQWLSLPGGKGDGNMMLICFTLGVIHLGIARVWNAITLFPDLKFLAQIGWVGVIVFMYFLAGNVVGVLPMPGFMKIVLGVSILLIACFMLKKEELKTNGADLGMLPLNIIGCLGDIISYVRLFAVGLAGVKVAENFNEMATNFDWPLYLKIIPMILILLLGHALNFAMAGLSVLVHAVRLNTLEFSNHKGISWAGIAFNPFRKTTLDE